MIGQALLLLIFVHVGELVSAYLSNYMGNPDLLPLLPLPQFRWFTDPVLTFGEVDGIFSMRLGMSNILWTLEAPVISGTWIRYFNALKQLSINCTPGPFK